MNEVFAGVDWGCGSHAVCVIDAKAQVLDRFEAGHDREGLATLVARLKRQGSPPVAIERPTGLLVDHLVEAGFTVVPIHPNAVKACRPRYRAVSAKSDPGDAYILADVLRTDGHRLTPLTPQSDAIKALRALVRGRDDLVAAPRGAGQPAHRAAGRLLARRGGRLRRCRQPHRARLPGPLSRPRQRPAARPRPHGRLPRPAPLLRPPRPRGPAGAAAGCAHRLRRGRRTPGQGRAGSRPRAHAAGPRRSARPAHPPHRAHRGEPARRPADHVLSPRGENLRRPDPRRTRRRPRPLPTNDQLAAEAGVAPVTYQSGKSRGVGFRWACNKRLRQAVTCMADNSRHQSPWAADVYARARKRGKDHPHAVRILARAWVRILWRAWTDQQPYDPTKHNPANNRPEPALAAMG